MSATTSPTTAGTLAGSRVVSARLTMPARGVWWVDVDLDPTPPIVVPTGAATLKLGKNISLVGSIDAAAGGRFGASVRTRLLAGGGGWSSLVDGQTYQDPGGALTTTTVIAPVASSVGETLKDPSPTALGAHFVVRAGPAQEVFADLPWWVDPAGVTNLGPRPTATPDASVTVLGYDPEEGRLEVSTDALILPGTAIADTFTPPRWDGTLVVGDVVQTFTKDGSRATLWTAQTVTARLTTAMTNIVRAMSGRVWMRKYPYRYVSAGQGTSINLQAIAPVSGILDPGMPDMLNVAIHWGSPGVSAKLAPSQVVLVEFLFGDERVPTVTGVDLNLPAEVTVDGVTAAHLAPTAKTVDVGKGATEVDIAGGANFVALANLVDTKFSAFATWVLTGSGSGYTPPAGPAPTNSTAASKVKAT